MVQFACVSLAFATGAVATPPLNLHFLFFADKMVKTNVSRETNLLERSVLRFSTKVMLFA